MPFQKLLDKNQTILFAFFVIIITINMTTHAMWRDELQAWMIARYSSNLPDLFNNIRYESHPAAWHIWLFLISRFTDSPVIMQLLQWLSAIICGFCVIKYSPFSLLQKWLILFGYYLIFEYNVISRSYSMTLLWLIIFCCLWGIKKSPILSGIILLIIANTSIHGAIIAGALMSLTIFNAKDFTWHKKDYIIFSAITLTGIIICLLQLIPPSDRFIPADTFHLSKKIIAASFSTIWTAISAIPDMDGSRFNWNSSFITSPILRLILSVITFGVIIKIFIRQKTAMVCWIIGSGLLLIFFALIFMGYIRHHGHLYLLLLSVSWLVHNKLNIKELKLLTAIFAISTISGLMVSVSGWIHPFSNAKQAAHDIQQSTFNNLPILCAQDFTSSPVSGYLGRKVYYLQRGEWGNYIIWDTKRPEISPRKALQKAREFAVNNGPCLLITLQPLPYENNLELFKSYSGAIVADENYYIYLIDKSITTD